MVRFSTQWSILQDLYGRQIEIVIPFPKEQISEGWYKEVTVMNFMLFFVM